MPSSRPAPIEIPATEANRRFSELLRGVREDGATFVVTSHGRPVAQISAPPQETAHDERARQAEAWERLKARLLSQPALNLGPFRRDEAYDD